MLRLVLVWWTLWLVAACLADACDRFESSGWHVLHGRALCTLCH